MSDDYEPDDSAYSLDDVCERLDKIEAALRDNRWDGLGLVWLVVGPVVMSWVVGSGFSDMWNSKILYSLRYDVAYDQVTTQNKPTDCDFLHSPIGDKACHYEREVTTYNSAGDIIGHDATGTAASQAQAFPGLCSRDPVSGISRGSSDGGETWERLPEGQSCPDTIIKTVEISWTKVSEE